MNRHGGDIYENGIRLDFSASVNPFGMPEAAVNEGMNAVRYAGFYPDPYCTESGTESIPIRSCAVREQQS